MIRIILQNIILFILPTFVYLIFMIIRRRAQSIQEVGQLLKRAPLIWLLGAGCLLMLSGLAYFTTHTSGLPGESYQPPIYKDGKIIPGQRK